MYSIVSRSFIYWQSYSYCSWIRNKIRKQYDIIYIFPFLFLFNTVEIFIKAMFCLLSLFLFMLFANVYVFCEICIHKIFLFFLLFYLSHIKKNVIFQRFCFLFNFFFSVILLPLPTRKKLNFSFRFSFKGKRTPISLADGRS